MVTLNSELRPGNGELTTENKLWHTLFLLVVTVFAAFLYSANVSASDLTSAVDRHTISIDETLQLRVRYNGQAVFGEPDFSALDHQFEVLSTSRQQQFSNINGNSVSYTDWHLTLMPKKTGKLIIPSFKFKNNVSNAVEIEVLKSKTPSQASPDNPVFLETEIDKQTAYVQEQLLLTYRLYMATPLKNIGMSELTIPTTEIIKTSETNYKKTINGMSFDVIELKFALFPQSSGELAIPQIRFTGYIPRGNSFFDNFYRNGKRFTLLGDEKKVTVQPQPDKSVDYWLPAKDVTLSEKWNGNQDEWHVGEPLTRTITITALGATSSQLPELTMPAGDKHRIYPDQAKLDQNLSSYGVLSTRTESIAVVPSKPGTLELPPVTLTWWDTERNLMETAVLEGRTFNVLPSEEQAYSPSVPEAESTSATPDTQQENKPAGNNTLLWFSLAGNLILMVLIAMLVLRKRQPKTIESRADKSSIRVETESKLFSAIRESASNDQPKQLREALLAWAQHYWKDASISTLDQIGELIGNSELTTQLRTLDQSLYGSGDLKTDCTAIGSAIKTFRANGQVPDKQPAGALKPLYPQ